jgi:hypothetical protein
MKYILRGVGCFIHRGYRIGFWFSSGPKYQDIDVGFRVYFPHRRPR